MFENIRKKLKGYKTVAVSTFLVVASVLVTLYDQLAAVGVDIKAFLPADIPTKWVGIITACISMIFFYLRMVTTSGIGKGHPEDAPAEGEKG